MWYEWHAESFLTVPISPPPPGAGVNNNRDEGGNLPESQGWGFSSSTLSSPLSVSSPLADDESFFGGATTLTTSTTEGEAGTNGGGVRTPKSVNRSATLPTVFGTSTGVSSASAAIGFEVVKIGHTSLHNPGGRSSWIGL